MGDPVSTLRGRLRVEDPQSRAVAAAQLRQQLSVFVANGDNDAMISAHYCCLLAGLIPHVRVKIYPGMARGFVFEHRAELTADVDRFLSAPCIRDSRLTR